MILILILIGFVIGFCLGWIGAEDYHEVYSMKHTLNWYKQMVKELEKPK